MMLAAGNEEASGEKSELDLGDVSGHNGLRQWIKTELSIFFLFPIRT